MASDRSTKSRPYVVQSLKLQSFHAQQVFRRGFDLYTDAIYSLSVVLRAVGTEDQVRAMEELIDDRLNRAQNDIRNEIARLEKVVEDNGITLDRVNYSEPVVVEAKISSHRSARYAGILHEFDGLIAKLDALWLSGMIPDNEYSRILYEWKRRILKIASSARGTVRQAMIDSRKQAQQESASQSMQNKAADQILSGGTEPIINGESGNDEISMGDAGEMPESDSKLFGWLR